MKESLRHLRSVWWLLLVLLLCQQGWAQLTTTTDYQYSSTHLQVTKERTPQSDGSVLETQYTYPPDYTNGPYAALAALVQQNIITPVIQKKVIREMGSSRDVISTQIITYKLWSVGGKQVPLPYKVYSLLINSPLSEGLFTNYPGNSPDFTTLGTSTTYQVEIEYTDYDEKGNLLSLLSKGNQKTSYLWGYNGQYPIAEIQNANKTEVDAALSAAGTSRSDLSALTSDAQLQAKFTSIQNALQSIPALLKGYTYRVGVGMASMTDVMGKVTAYQYDGLSRLAEIRENDPSGSLIQSFGYHYQGQGLDNATSVSTSPGVTVPATPSLTGGTSTNCNFTISTSSAVSASCGGTVSLSASCSGNDCSGMGYSWSGPNGFTGSSSSVSLTAPGTAGSYTYTVTASKSGCTSQQKQVTLTVSCGGTGTCNYTNNQLLGSTSGKNIYVKVVGNCKYIAFEPGGETRALDWLYVLVNNGGWASGVTPLTSDQIPVCFKQPGESCSGGCSTPGAPSVSASATSINSGQSSTLTASNCSGTVSWSSGQSGSSIQVSPTATTTYTATCTVGSCSSPASSGVTVTVGNRLQVAISGITGQASTKKRVTISNPYSGNRTYLWYIYRDSDMQYIGYGTDISSSTGVFDVDLASYNLVSGTVYRLYVGDTGDSGNSRHGYNTFTIGSSASNCNFTVSTPSTVSAGCGGTVSLSASCSGNDCSGVSYSWSGPNNFTGSGSSVSLTAPGTAGSYTYTVTASKSGCTSQQKQVTLTVSCGGTGTCNYTNNQLLGHANGVNAGQALYVKVVGNCKYIAFEPGGETRALDWLYMLRNNNGWASGVTPLTSDQIPVCFKQPSESCPGGCSTPGAPSVSASATSINSGQSSTLTASNCSGTVSWSSGQSGSSIQVSPTATTTYTATCTVGSCSSPASSGVTVTVNTPASTTLQVVLSAISGQPGTKKHVKVTNPYSGNRGYLWYVYVASDLQNGYKGGDYTTSSTGEFDVDLSSLNLTAGTVYRLYVRDNQYADGSRDGFDTFTFSSSSSSSCAFTVSTPSTASAGCGGTVSLSASCSGNDCSGVSYSWSGPNNFTGSGSSVSLTAPGTAGSYTYTVTASKSGCTSQQKQVTLTVSCGGQVSQPRSQVDGGDCTSIWGWAFDGGNTQSSVSLDVYINGTKTATIPTNVSRADVASYYGTGSYNMYGFSYSIPASVKNGTQLSVSLKFAGTQTELSGSPKVIGVCQGSGGCATGAPSVSASATSITSGQKVTLSASGCSGTVTWSNGQTGSSLVVRPAASMQYTATCSANGCTSSASATVSIQVTTSIAAGCYRIQGFQSEKYLQDRGLNTQLQQYTSNGQNNQLWKVESVGSGLMKIISTSSGYGWDIDGASQSDGAILKLYSYGGGSNQQFGISYVNDEYGGFRVTPSHASNKCVEIGGFSVSDGGNAAQQGYAGNGNQRWVFVPATCPAN
ncbi:RICIN domain-containing protein [Siphonobacter sp. SORGH_AS_1065]|uniref:RICIN domain-containing protein n=1 Tax=Siphonobacter sp. SORGH_AS_1065 TaxID=3041795 RepID=UPI00277F4B95|nr:RICIN domain-containing protein [Siphonobacter sp. SORGH_AS_1065]MDQ1087569.1 YD repeat-containing protein [Siphonobacter sp. SORGH_AS_1065]